MISTRRPTIGRAPVCCLLSLTLLAAILFLDEPIAEEGLWDSSADSIPADDGSYTTAAAASAPAASVPAEAQADYPGREDGFVREVNAQGEETFRLDCGTNPGTTALCGQAETQGGGGCLEVNNCANNQVYVIPANDYYAWHAQYYCATCHLTSSILHALLFAHIYHSMMYPRVHFYSTVVHTYHVPTTPYYSSAAYSSRYSTPTTSNGRVVHNPTPAARAGQASTPVARGTPVAQGRPVAGAPGAGGVPVARGTPVAQGTPVAHGTPVAQARPVAGATPTAKPAARSSFFGSLFGSRSSTSTPTAASRPSATSYSRYSSYSSRSSGWSSARTSFRSSCFGATAPVTRPDGHTTPISQIQIGDLVAGWSRVEAAVAGEPPRPLRVAAIQHVTAGAPPLLGAQLRLSTGVSVLLPPFVTPNHALLSADGVWRAVDVLAAQAEIDDYIPNATLTAGAPLVRPRVAPLTAGTTLLRAPSVAAELPPVSVSRRLSTTELNATLRTDMASGATAAVLEALIDEEGGGGEEVFSLELEVGGFAAYLVHGLLVID